MTIRGGGILADGQNFVIGRIKFDNSSGTSVLTAVDIKGMGGVHPTGVVHSCEFINARTNIFGVYGTLDAMAPTHALPYPYGDPRSMVYIEGNSYTKTTSTAANVIDGRMSARVVFRYNTVVSDNSNPNAALYIEAHSIQDNTSLRGFMRWEHYNNVLDNQGGGHYMPFRLRAGTGLVFNNSVTGNWTNDQIALDNRRTYDQTQAGTLAGMCDGSSPWDGNEDATGYPCRDQIGRGYDAVQWVSNPPGAYTQVLMPAYSWNNKNETGGELPFTAINGCDIHIKPNRDFYNYTAAFNGTSGVGRGLLSARPATCTVNTAYFATNDGPLGTLYKCTATNTWTKHFEPYTCPHPLAGLTGTCSPDVAGTSGYNL